MTTISPISRLEIDTYNHNNQHSTFSTLPDELIRKLFTYFTEKGDFSAFSETCKRMDRILSQMPVYETVPIAHTRCNDTPMTYSYLRNTQTRESLLKLLEALSADTATSQNAENAFYVIFKQNCFRPDIKINWAEILRCYYSAHQCFMRMQPEHPFLSLQGASNNFSNRLLDDFVNIIANHISESSPCFNFKTSARELFELTSRLHVINDKKTLAYTEALLRNVLRNKHHKVFENYHKEFSNTSLTSPVVIFTREQLKKDLSTKETELEHEYMRLQPASDSLGLIYEARHKVQVLEAQLEEQNEIVKEARTKFQYIASEEHFRSASLNVSSKVRNRYNWDGHPLSLEQLSMLQLDSNTASDELKQARQHFRETVRNRDVKNNELREAKEKYKSIAARSAALAQYKPGTNILSGGELFEVREKLKHIDALALEKVKLLSQLYKELGIFVTEENKQVCYAALDQICNALKKFS